MATYNQEQIKKFFVSLWWNLGVYLVLFATNLASERIGGFNLSANELAVASIILSRITKVINVQLQSRQELE